MIFEDQNPSEENFLNYLGKKKGKQIELEIFRSAFKLPPSHDEETLHFSSLLANT